MEAFSKYKVATRSRALFAEDLGGGLNHLEMLECFRANQKFNMHL